MIDPSVLPILMPLWDRLERLPRIVGMLNGQTDQEFMPIFFLNGRTEWRRQTVQRALTSLMCPYYLKSDTENLGGWARFRGFRDVYADAESPPPAVATVDDDVDLKPNFVAWAKAKAEPKTIWGRHAFRFQSPTSAYWARTGAGDDEHAEDAHMVSTQASVLDPEVLLSPTLYNVDPADVLGMEDMWLCYVASTFHGYRIRGARPPATVIVDGKDTWPRIRERKNGLLQTLRVKGWDV